MPDMPAPIPNDRYVEPDCEEIRQLIRKDPSKRSADTIFFEAEILSGARLLHSWEKGLTRPFRTTLTRLAEVLHNCKNVKQITNNDIQIPNLGNSASSKNDYADLIADAMFSKKYFFSVLEAGGVEQIDVGEFTRKHFPTQVASLGMTMAEMHSVHIDLCRIGLLQELANGSGPQFIQREPHERQCYSYYYNRVNAEQNAIRYAYFASCNPENDGAIREFNRIVKKQALTLEQLKAARMILRKEPNCTNALEVVFLDSEFVQGWAGYDTSHTMMLKCGVGGHLQLIKRLIVVHTYLERNGIAVPTGYSTLPQLVDSFYEEASDIFRMFLKATTTRENTIDKVLEVVQRYVVPGYNYIEQASFLTRLK